MTNDYKRKLTCDGCKKGIMMTVSGAKRVNTFAIYWVCRWCDKANKSEI